MGQETASCKEEYRPICLAATGHVVMSSGPLRIEKDGTFASA